MEAQVSQMDLQHPRSYRAAVSLAAAAGLLLAASSPPAALPITAFPSLLLLFHAVRGLAPHRDAVWPVLAYFLVGWGFSYGWILDHVWPGTAIVSLLLLILLALLSALLARTGYRLAGVPGLTAAIMLLEGVMTFGPVPMPLMSAGYTVSGTAWAGLVPLLGITGASFLMWIVAAVSTRWPHRVQVPIAALWIVIALLRPDPGSRSPLPESSQPLSLGLVQPGMDAESWADVRDDSRVDALAALSTPAAGLLIWPETALPVGTAVRQDSLLQRLVTRPIITGGIVENEEGVMYNAAAYWNPSGQAAEERLVWSGKRRLIPLVEYIPGLELLPWLHHLRVDSGGARGYTPGRERAIWAVGNHNVSALICFESLFAAEARSAARQGADVLVVLSQDGWWDSDRMPLQHRDMTALVARATGRSVVMVGVSGWSGVLSESGRVIKELPEDVPVSEQTNITPRPIQTVYLAVGELFSVLFFLAVVSIGFFEWKRHD